MDELRYCLNDFKDKNNLLLIKTKEVVGEVEPMNSSCFIAKTTGECTAGIGVASMTTGVCLAPFSFGSSLGVSMTGGVLALLGSATKLGTELVEKVALKIFCDKLRPLAKERDRASHQLGERFDHILANNYKGKELSFEIEGVLAKINEWNDNPSVENLFKLIKDLEKDSKLTLDIE